MKIVPITHSIIYYSHKAKETFFAAKKIIEGPETPEGPK